jgi:lipid II:glycine glycyltransferase (peptidoglycan interpeptide bridge formation enzyme)
LTNKEQYRKLCSTHSLPVFLQDWWLDAVCSDWNAAIAKNGDNIAGVWPYAITKRIGVDILRNTMLTPYMGPHVCYPADLKESNRDSFEHETIAALLQQLPAAKVWNLSVQPGIKQAGIFKNYGLQVQVQQTFLIDLSKDEQELLAGMKENLRRNIRSAGTEYEITDDRQQVEALYKYQQHTLTAKGAGQPYTVADMQQLMDVCKQEGKTALWTAKKDNEVHALVWNVWDADTSYYFMGAQKPGGDSYRAMSVLLWHAIRQAKMRGNKTFDLEGSMDAGVERFFRNFGGQRELYLVLKKNESLLWKVKEVLKK